MNNSKEGFPSHEPPDTSFIHDEFAHERKRPESLAVLRAYFRGFAAETERPDDPIFNLDEFRYYLLEALSRAGANQRFIREFRRMLLIPEESPFGWHAAEYEHLSNGLRDKRISVVNVLDTLSSRVIEVVEAEMADFEINPEHEEDIRKYGDEDEGLSK